MTYDEHRAERTERINRAAAEYGVSPWMVRSPTFCSRLIAAREAAGLSRNDPVPSLTELHEDGGSYRDLVKYLSAPTNRLVATWRHAFETATGRKFEKKVKPRPPVNMDHHARRIWHKLTPEMRKEFERLVLEVGMMTSSALAHMLDTRAPGAKP